MTRRSEPDRRRIWLWLAALTVVSAALYATLLLLAPRYALGVETVDRPILLVIGLYAAAFVPYGLAIRSASRLPTGPSLLAWIIGSSVLFRLILLPTPPFQEIDIYRYLLDGAVATHGENPYRYPPDTVEAAIDTLRGGGQVTDDRLDRLARAALAEPWLEEVVRRIHYAHLPSPYPPISQLVFAAPAWLTPSDWSAAARLTLLKGVLTLFDIATLLVVIALVRRAGLPVGLSLAYGWCPLVMKEVAGSGHLDSIAIFFAMAALWAGWNGLSAADASGRRLGLTGSALLLALGVGAKLYPVILAPLLCFGWLRRRGFGAALGWSLLFLAATAGCLAPMFVGSPPPRPVLLAEGDGELPPAPDESAPADAFEGPRTDPTAGLSAFLTQWEMNDFLFMLVVENLRPQADVEPPRRPWFTVVPDRAADALTGAWQRLIDPERRQTLSSASFLLARVLTGLAFAVIALVIAWRASPIDAAEAPAAERWLRAGFLTVAWFWLLAPTQNPWYWCWALPLLPFARLRAWHALAAFCLLYYLRFWLSAHCPQPGVLGTPYDGKYFFYFVVPWVEFLPWMVWLAAEAWYCRRSVHRLTDAS